MKKCSAIRVCQAYIGWMDTFLRGAIAIAIVASEWTKETSAWAQEAKKERKKKKEKYSIISSCSFPPHHVFPDGSQHIRRATTNALL